MTATQLPPGPRLGSPIGTLHFLFRPLDNVRLAARRYGPVFKTRFPGFGLMIYVNDPELVKEVFAGDPAVFHAGEATATVLLPAVGPSSVLTLDEGAHMRQRKLLLPPFHGENVRRWADTILEITDRDMETWPVGEPFSLRGHTQRITLDVILRAVFGVREQDRFARARTLVDRFARDANLIVLFPGLRRNLGRWSPWQRFKRARTALDEFLYEEIALRREQPDLADRDDVLSLLLCARDEDGQAMSDRELRDELVTVIGAGHETTATGLAWAFERLLRNPRVLGRLERSLEEGDEYLDATVKETLRMRPVILDIARRLTHEIELGGYRLPAGALVIPSIAAIHYREDLYPQPDEFRPERFLEDPPKGTSWLPFGGGVRRCVGASFAQFEMRVIIRAILERATLRAARPRAERPRLRNITIAPARGCRVVLEAPLRAARYGAEANARPADVMRPEAVTSEP